MLMAAVAMSSLMAASCGKQTGDEGGSAPFVSTALVYMDDMFQPGMVLQRNKDVVFSGHDGTPGQPVRVSGSWAEDKYYCSVVSGDGTWEVKVPMPEAGGPYEIYVEGKNKVRIPDVLIGDVWFCSGQSNMQMTVKETQDADDAVANPNIRFFDIRTRVQSDKPDASLVKARWETCNIQTAKEFSAAGYFFGKTLQTELNIPIGLINASWGNTPCEVWTKRELVMADPELKADAERLEGNGSAQPNRAGNVYNAMVWPFRKFPIAGVVWYQGENNMSAAWRYGRLLNVMIENWREDWGYDFPFIVSEICLRYRQYDYLTYYSNAVIRDQQRRVADMGSNRFVTVNDDISDLNDIHPKNKKDVGQRMAWTALYGYYGVNGFADRLCPVLDKVEQDGPEIKVFFKNAPDGLRTSDGARPSGFEIAGADKVFYPADAVIEDSCVKVSSASVPAPVYVRLGWSYFKIHNLRSRYGLPVSAFTTQDFPDSSEEQGSKG